MNTVIRPYTEEDENHCMEAFMTNVPEYFTSKEADDYKQWLKEKAFLTHNHYYVLIMDEKVVACGGFGYDPENIEVRFIWGLVHKLLHRKGIGKELLQFRLKEISRLYPGIPIRLDTTQFSFAFFEKLGFQIDKITNDFYAQGYHRYDMTRII